MEVATGERLVSSDRSSGFRKVLEGVVVFFKVLRVVLIRFREEVLHSWAEK